MHKSLRNLLFSCVTLDLQHSVQTGYLLYFAAGSGGVGIVGVTHVPSSVTEKLSKQFSS